MPTTRRVADMYQKQNDIVEQLAQDPSSSTRETALFYRGVISDAPVQSPLSGGITETTSSLDKTKTRASNQLARKIAAEAETGSKETKIPDLSKSLKVVKAKTIDSSKASMVRGFKTTEVLNTKSFTTSKDSTPSTKPAEDAEFFPSGGRSANLRTMYFETSKRTTRSDSGVGRLTREEYAQRAIRQRIKSNELDALLNDTDRFTKKRKRLSHQHDGDQILTTDVEAAPIRRPAKKRKTAMVEKVSSSIKGGYLGRKATYVLRISHKKFQGIYAPIPKGKARNQAGFLFGHNPFWHLTFNPPSPQECQLVLDILSNYHKEKDKVGFELSQESNSSPEVTDQNGPAHASVGITIDNVVKVIMSQATNNKLALREHANLRARFTYDVDGKKHIGDIPNYHKIRLCTQDELEAAVKGAGLFKARATAILKIIDAAFQANCHRQGIDPALTTSENEPDAKDFVPGLLSLDYLHGMDKNELMDYFVKLPGIGVKTTACILAFNLKMPVFAVDVHVLAMARLLKWIPKECLDADKACMFLDRYIPDDLKYPLHQAFWHHRVKCIRCKEAGSGGADGDRRSKAWLETICPLEYLIDRDIDKFSSKRVISKKTVDPTRTTDDDNSIKVKTEKRKLSYMSFNSIKPDKAYEQGYVLITEDIDIDFGVTDVVETHITWVLKELVSEDRIISLEDAKERGLIITKPQKSLSKGQKTMDEYIKTKDDKDSRDTNSEVPSRDDTTIAEADAAVTKTEDEIVVTGAGTDTVVTETAVTVAVETRIETKETI